MAKLGSEAPAVAASVLKAKQSLPDNTDNSTNGDQPTVNRKKQKRREKLAAKLAASQPYINPKVKGSHGMNGTSRVKSATSAANTGSYQHVNGNPAKHLVDDDELFYSDEVLE